MFFGDNEYCPFCGKSIGFRKFRTKDGFAVCPACFSDLEIKKTLFCQQSLDTIAGLRNERQENCNTFRKFTVTTEVKAGIYILRMDSYNKLWYVAKQTRLKNPVIFRFDELCKFELLQDGDSVCGGGLGLSLVGGALFGGAGAVAGAVVGSKKTKKILNSLDIVITTNRPFRTGLRIDLLPFGSCKSNSTTYKMCMNEATDAMQFLNAICEACKKSASAVAPTQDVADILLKYKSLLDSGVLTEEEFNKKKQELLQ